MGGALSSTEVDLIFVKSKPKFERRLGAWALPPFPPLLPPCVRAQAIAATPLLLLLPPAAPRSL